MLYHYTRRSNCSPRSYLHWNTIDTGRVVDALRERAKLYPSTCFPACRPLTWEQVNLTGD
ncbi:transposon-related protein (plasmid) [Sinorhizobium fredii HH103]|nr:hypothetical protein SFHH103_04769 [Sinorhizobium fredii HH103]CEO91263.1 transposon-related protein [Sinorhizobium fredii HH103]